MGTVSPVSWESFIKPLTTIDAIVAHDSVASSKTKVELDSHADKCGVGNNFLVIHDHMDQSMSTVMIQKMVTDVPKRDKSIAWPK